MRIKLKYNNLKTPIGINLRILSDMRNATSFLKFEWVWENNYSLLSTNTSKYFTYTALCSDTLLMRTRVRVSGGGGQNIFCPSNLW